MLTSGGILVYSTCTINRSENEDMVENFLKMYDDFSIETGPAGLEDFRTTHGFYRTVPYRHHMDGMFAVRMRKS